MLEVDTKHFSGLSMRRGGISAGLVAGVPEPILFLQSGHGSNCAARNYMVPRNPHTSSSRRTTPLDSETAKAFRHGGRKQRVMGAGRGGKGQQFWKEGKGMKMNNFGRRERTARARCQRSRSATDSKGGRHKAQNTVGIKGGTRLGPTRGSAREESGAARSLAEP